MGWGRAKSRPLSHRPLPQAQPYCLRRRKDRPDRLRQLGSVRPMGGPSSAVRGSISPRSLARLRRRQPYRIHRPGRCGHVGAALSDIRHNLAGLQQYGGNNLYVGVPGTAGHPRSVTTDRSQPGRGQQAKIGCSPRNTRWSGGSRQTVTTSAISRVSTGIAPAPSCATQDLPVGRSRRILVGRTAGQRRSGARCRRPSRVFQRQRSVLEDALGGEHRGRAPRTAPSSATRKRTPTRR